MFCLQTSRTTYIDLSKRTSRTPYNDRLLSGCGAAAQSSQQLGNSRTTYPASGTISATWRLTTVVLRTPHSDRLQEDPFASTPNGNIPGPHRHDFPNTEKRTLAVSRRQQTRMASHGPFPTRSCQGRFHRPSVHVRVLSELLSTEPVPRRTTAYNTEHPVQKKRTRVQYSKQEPMNEETADDAAAIESTPENAKMAWKDRGQQLFNASRFF